MNQKLIDLEKEIKEKFPNVWIKDGARFSAEQEGSLWTGEGSMMPDDREAFDYYTQDYKETHYQMGVHKALVKVLDAHGFYAEAHDPGTYFLREA